MSASQKLSERMAEMVSIAVRDGVFDAGKNENDRNRCRRLDSYGLFRRDLRDSGRYYPTDAARERFAGSAAEPQSVPERDTIAPPTGERFPHHALADLFPMLSDAELNELSDDIAARGQENPVWIFQGQIVDGRNREEACHRAGIVPKYSEYRGDDPLGFVLSLNLRRRHLTESQRAMVAAKIVDWERGMNQSSAGSANLPTREAARRLSISERAVVSAKRIREHGSLALIQAIDSGRIKVSAGAEISYLERQAQDEAIRAEERQIAARAKELRNRRLSINRASRTNMINLIAQQGKVSAGEMPRAAFPLGYCDFPWEQEAYSNETGQDKGLKYPSMTVDEGMRLCAGEKSPFTRDAKLYFWTTTNRFRDAIRIIEAWGFAYVTAITWDKVDIGMGREVRDRTEHLLICKRGEFPGIDLYTAKPPSLYTEKKTQHSRKPVWFAEEIERLHPTMRKLELFQRRESLAQGDIRLNGQWHFWGFEAGDAQDREAAE
ncbi:Spo0J and IME4 domain-containing protein [Neorhizobium alkalisoli]|uniref:MT-A70 protein n=1 Tax=Neorhizobium alkalisoli TaxID=528178 RepID=A0A561QSH0_9HYPH|nr:MT-A70 family methyltransferase [Neorhizobium alkalisoli]TWF53246.1 MT-A70 protein [Neorhizobium alkalisoli]